MSEEEYYKRKNESNRFAGFIVFICPMLFVLYFVLMGVFTELLGHPSGIIIATIIMGFITFKAYKFFVK